MDSDPMTEATAQAILSRLESIETRQVDLESKLEPLVDLFAQLSGAFGDVNQLAGAMPGGLAGLLGGR